MSDVLEELARLRNICEAATPGEWEAVFEAWDVHDFWAVQTFSGERIAIGDQHRNDEANLRFIAIARTAMPVLLDMLGLAYTAIKDAYREVADGRVEAGAALPGDPGYRQISRLAVACHDAQLKLGDTLVGIKSTMKGLADGE